MPFNYTTPLFQEFWDRAQTLSTTPGFNGWTTKKTGSGTPTYVIAGRELTVTLDNTSEAQVAVLYQNNVLPWKLSELDWIEFLIKVGSIDAVTTLVAGLASSQNDTADSVVTNAWFRMEGSASTSNLVVESDDGSTDNNDVATGTTLGSSFKQVRLDFTQGLANSRFYVGSSRVASGTTFDLSAVASSFVQPLFQIQKGSGTGTPSFTLGPIKARRRYLYT